MLLSLFLVSLFPELTPWLRELLMLLFDMGAREAAPRLASASACATMGPCLSLLPSLTPQQTIKANLSSMGSLHSTQRFMTAAQAVQETMWLHGLNNTSALASEQTVQ